MHIPQPGLWSSRLLVPPDDDASVPPPDTISLSPGLSPPSHHPLTTPSSFTRVEDLDRDFSTSSPTISPSDPSGIISNDAPDIPSKNADQIRPADNDTKLDELDAKTEIENKISPNVGTEQNANEGNNLNDEVTDGTRL